MRASEGSAATAAIGIVGNGLHRSAKICTFGRAAKAIWRKPAQELAFRCNVSERTAKYWLSGEYPPSAEALLAVMDEIVRK